ncbi:MAG: methyltransferase domain-containing protein [Chloroflexi bacterium]|jgi:SAM-dependent methyltransferase|nr:methyltransferase domain-containing protein [Chloroflexota bacterium]
MLDEATFLRLTRNEADMAFKKRVRCVFEWLQPTDEKVILDCGCGRGFYLNIIRAVSACKLYGLEVDAAIIAKARRNLAHLPDIALVQASIYEQPFGEAQFDGVILSEVLEHIEDDVRGLREVYRVLKPGGVVAITVPNANYPFWWDPINKSLEALGLPPIKRGVFAGIWANHVRLYTKAQLRQVVEAAGFIVEEERAFTHYCFPFIHNLVYGFGKPLLESGVLPERLARAADRTAFDQNDGSLLNPINLGLAILNWFDRPNRLDEPDGRATVNLALKARKPS